jgi:hypothetical protein
MGMHTTMKMPNAQIHNNGTPIGVGHDRGCEHPHHRRERQQNALTPQLGVKA